MGKKKESKPAVVAQVTGFIAPSASVDPALASLFASSSGPIKVLERVVANGESNRARHSKVTTNGRRPSLPADAEAVSLSSTSFEREEADDEDSRDKEDALPRKRRKIHRGDDLESTYLHKLARDDLKDKARSKALRSQKQHQSRESGAESDVTSYEEASDGEGDDKVDEASMSSGAEADLPQHESLTTTNASSESDKSKRTVFLGNVSTSAIKSKSAKNTLLEHLRVAVKELPKHEPAHKVESLRFRSTAFVSGAGPKKAAFAKGELMDQTTKSTNAYVVYTTELAALKAAPKLNGTLVLDRHLRADSLSAPTKIEHRRCVFVGNISFVDEETQDPKNDDGTERRPKAKVPADAEEGLWRAFSKAGKVESVRVVRDKETRIGKGFAYVQFFDENAVEAALLMNDKKFPPMLPRKIRVMRAKRTKQQSSGRNNAGFDSGPRSKDKKFSKQDRRFGNGSKPGIRIVARPRTKEGVVFEGHRASKSSRESNIVSKHRKRHAVKPSTRSSKRGAAFKAAGGKRTKT